jgi:carbamoyltransferase
VWYQLLENPRVAGSPDGQSGSLLGPEFSHEEIRGSLEAQSAVFRRAASSEALCEETAGFIASGKVVGWVQGRMEYGPRALGNRSILGDARNAQMQSTMNLKIKFRESFRPFAPIVLADRAPEYFGMQPGEESPYMLVVSEVCAGQRRSSEGPPLSGLSRVKEIRSTIPAVTHVDGSARVQTVDPVRNPLLHSLLMAFDRQTGCPVMINTSFNVRSEPVVCTPADAYRCFMATDLDVLVVGPFILMKGDQPPLPEGTRAAYLDTFEID